MKRRVLSQGQSNEKPSAQVKAFVKETQRDRQAELKELSSVITLRCLKKLRKLHRRDVNSRGTVSFELRVRHRLLLDQVHAQRVERQVAFSLSQSGYRSVGIEILPAARYHLLGDTAADITESIACIVLGFYLVPLASLAVSMRTAWATVEVNIEV